MESTKTRGAHRAADASRAPGEGWYVINQGREIKVEHHSSTPSTAHKPGEKMIRASGPYADQETAQKVVDRMRGKVERRPIRSRGAK